MTKQPFTPDGVKLKSTELYALHDDELQEQAVFVASQFRTWIKDNFNLTTEQANYLDAMDQQYLKFLADETSDALGIRLPIILISPGIPPGGTGSKRIDGEKTKRGVLDAGIVKPITGEWRITISYPEP